MWWTETGNPEAQQKLLLLQSMLHLVMGLEGEKKGQQVCQCAIVYL